MKIRAKTRFRSQVSLILFMRRNSYYCAVQNEIERRVLFKAFHALSLDLRLTQLDTATLFVRLKYEGISFVTKCLPLLNQAVLQGLRDGHFDCPTQFRQARNSKLPIFLGSFVSRIFHRDGELRSDAQASAVREIRQLCEYAYKADFAYAPSQISEVISRFKENERIISENPIKDDAILRMCAFLTSEFFSGVDFMDLIPKHGPGVTSNVPINDKYDYVLHPNLPVYKDYGSNFFFSPNDAFDSLDRFPISGHFDLFRSSVSAKVILVPKDARGPRLISCEPAENQYIQQGLMSKIVSHIESHPLTAGHVNFTDQTINQDLAREASITGDMATLDLKDASDMNSLSLFSHIFRSTPLLDAILACRTPTTVLPNGEKVPMSKFAPMGSALCFPIMAYSIYILLYASLIGIGRKDFADRIYVYGDDIVVPTEVAQHSMNVLERYLFKVNDRKSFYTGNFRESCGGDFFRGESVAPIRLRKIHSAYGKDRYIRGVAFAFAKHANELSIGGLHHTAEMFYLLVERVFGRLPYGTARAAYIHRHCREDELSSLNSFVMKNGFPFIRKGHVTKTIFSSGGNSVWGHLNRVIRLMGQDFDNLPQIGEYSLPKDWTIVCRPSLMA